METITRDRRAISALKKTIVSPANVLLKGIGGTGKEALLRKLARLLLCVGNGSDSCECESCKRGLDYHPDFLYIAPDGESIKKEQADKIIEETSIQPQIARRKVILLSRCDRFLPGAANALLKTLEEGKALFLLSSDNDSVLDTIESRCRVIELDAELPESYKIPIGDEELFDTIVAGRIEYAKEFEENGTFAYFEKLDSLLRKDIKGKSELLSFFHALKEKDEEEFWQSSTPFLKDSVLRLLSSRLFCAHLQARGIYLDFLVDTEALARLYKPERICELCDITDKFYTKYSYQSLGKNDWFNYLVELTK